MGKYFGINMPDSAWQQMSGDEKLKYLSNRGGPTGNFIDSMQRSKADHPDWGGSNYWDAVYNALARGGGKIPSVHLPYAASGIGMMSGDAGGDIANAHADTTTNYGSDPRNDALTGELRQTIATGQGEGATPEQKAAAQAIISKQQQRVGEWMGHMGQNLGSMTGTADAYEPGAGAEWASIEGYDPATGRVNWTPRRRR